MPWIVLLASAVFEAVWATALGMSEGLTRPLPTAVFAVALVVSMAGLAIAMRQIPLSVAYAVWTGVGAALTVAFAMATGAEPFTWTKTVFLAGIIGCVIGLRLLKTPSAQGDRQEAGQP